MMQSNVDLTKEMALLRASVHAHFDEYKDPCDVTGSIEGVDWSRVLWLGRLHGVLLFLREALGRCSARIPDDIAAQLNAINQASIRRRLARGTELCRLHDALQRAGIEAIAMSGWVFTERFYALPRLLDVGTITPYAVRAADRARAAEVLKPIGYLVDDPLENVTSARSRVKLRHDLDDKIGSDLWDRTHTLAVAGRTLRVLAPTDWLTLLRQRIDGSSWTPLYHAINAISLERHLGMASSYHLIDKAVSSPIPTGMYKSHEGKDDDDSTTTHGEKPAGNFIATPVTFVERMLELAETGEHDVVYDLGCGDGTAVITAASKFGARGVGIDNDPVRIAEAQAAAAAVADRVQFMRGDLFTADVSDATVLFLYLHQSVYGDIQRNVITKLKPGTRVVSRDSVFRGWIPEKSEVVSISPAAASMIYRWTVK